MFVNAVPLQGNDVEQLFYKMFMAINECFSNQEEYITFQFIDAQEIIIKALENAFKKMHYTTFLCYYMYGESDMGKSECWYLKISWKLSDIKRGAIN